ncbi:MAG: hypothetical protein WCK75_10610 [Elusimicrobiota bacterium]
MEEKKEEVAGAVAPKGSEAPVEPAKVRSGGKVLKIVAIIFSVLSVLLICAALFMYQKLSGFKDLLMPPSEPAGNSAFSGGDEGNGGTLPDGFKGFGASVQDKGGSALTVFTNAAEYAQAAASITPEDAEKAADAFAKYANRGIVKDFMAELNKDPDFIQALKEKDANNPLAMIASVQKVKSIQGLALKFIMRKDFMPLMVEVMNDPEVKPFLGKLPMGNMGPAGQMLKMMSGMSQAPSAEMAQSESDAASEEEEREPAMLDNSAMQSPTNSTGASRKKKNPPLPIE